MENKKIIAIGEALIDFIPDKTGCAFSEVTGFAPKVGGAPANVCGAFSRLGGSSMLITQLGNDPFGHKIADELATFGIDTSAVRFTDEANTALAFVSLENDGNRTFSFYRKPSADLLLTSVQIEEKWFDNSYALHFCSVSLGDFPMKDAHIRAIEIARKNGMLVSFDPNLRFPLWNDRNKLHSRVNEFIPLCDILKISDEELEFITGENDIRKTAPKLFKKWREAHSLHLRQGRRICIHRKCGSIFPRRKGQGSRYHRSGRWIYRLVPMEAQEFGHKR